MAALELAREHAETGPVIARPALHAGSAAWFKAEPLPARARLRHAARSWFLRRPLPRFAEYVNLKWLGVHCFDAPAPLSAGAWWHGGLPHWQFLVTERINDARPLDEVLADSTADVDDLLAELAREVARLHSLRFIHRDLFARNFLVRVTAAPRRLVFLDAWRGGARPQLRGVGYDLACLFLHLPAWLSMAQQVEWFELYVSERAVQGRPVAGVRLADEVARERLRLEQSYRRRGREAELPQVHSWSFQRP